MIVDIFLKIAQNIPLSQSEMEELSAYISASHTTTAKITNMQELSELGYDLGEVWAGRFIASADPSNNDVSSSTFSGTYMDSSGVTGKSAGVVQTQMRSSDGKITAGAGAVTLDENGVGIVGGSGVTNSVKIMDGNERIVYLGGYTTALENHSLLYSPFRSGYSGEMIVGVSADTSSKLSLFAGANIIYVDTTNGIILNQAGTDCDTIIKGDTTTIVTVDAGLEAVGIGGAAESGKKLKVTGDVHITGATTLDGNVTLGDAAADTLTFNGTPAGQIVSGTYSPTPTKVTNFTTGTVTMRTCQYMRVGSVVTVSGAFNADPDATGSCVFTFTLPIASNLANSYELAGAGATDQTTPVALMIRGSSTADAAVVSWSATTASAQEAYFTLTYRII